MPAGGIGSWSMLLLLGRQTRTVPRRGAGAPIGFGRPGVSSENEGVLSGYSSNGNFYGHIAENQLSARGRIFESTWVASGVPQEPEQELVREHVYGIDGSKPGSVHLVTGGSQCAREPRGC